MDADTTTRMDSRRLQGAPCQCFHPRFLVACTLPAHPHKVSHHASGRHEGTHWTLFWWDQGAQHDHPEEPADMALPLQLDVGVDVAVDLDRELDLMLSR